jgi:hypothetical protein
VASIIVRDSSVSENDSYYNPLYKQDTHRLLALMTSEFMRRGTTNQSIKLIIFRAKATLDAIHVPVVCSLIDKKLSIRN